MIVTSWGGAENVTGSKHLLEVNGKRILFDCGMFQGKREESERKNRHFGFDAASLDAVVLSHAHIDHSGLLPMLVKYGYRGCVYATPATRDLCAVMLQDSARIQERDAEWLSKKNRTYMPPLYDDGHVRDIMRKFVSIPYEVPFLLFPDMTITFHDAGHVLGSAMVVFDYEEAGQRRRFLFSGDIGRKNMSILQDPWEPNAADAVLMEATYGDRDHGPMDLMEERLAKIIHETHARGGKIIVPTFALERAQELIYALKRLETRNAIPPIPVFVDSPLTVNITHIFRLHTEAFDQEFRDTMERDGDPFELRRIRYISSVSDSMELNSLEGPAIILSAAGMCEHGRILHHLRNHCGDPRNTILIIGYQAQDTLGRRIVERQKEIRIFGIKRPLNAEVRIMNEFSAHAGRSELIQFGKRFSGSAERILLVHGEPQSLASLREALLAEGLERVDIQREGQPVEV